MITVRLIGGLGNQMFQYAAARRLSLVRGVSLELDVTGFHTYHLHHGFRLNHLALPDDITYRNRRRVLDALPDRPQNVMRKLVTLLGGRPQSIVRERQFHFDPSILHLGDHVYLDGYWQSSKYFEDVSAAIRGEFKVREPLMGRNLDCVSQMNSSVAVSLHVRRGDYASDSNTNRFHGLCGPEYYDRAERFLLEKVGKVTLFVFSDDAEWAQANLRLQSPTIFVRHNDQEREYEDLRLISACRHHIIANSTFSWWGAWLSASPGKIVIAPKKWFREATHSTRDLIPEDWIRL